MTKATKAEKECIARDYTYWRNFASKLGWHIYGFNGSSSAAFWVTPGGCLIEMTRNEVEHTLKSLELYYPTRCKPKELRRPFHDLLSNSGLGLGR